MPRPSGPPLLAGAADVPLPLGLEHVFCADATASKNYYALMQLAYLLWTLFCHGLLTRLHARATKTAQATLAQLLLKGLRATGAADPGWRACQIRFVT